MTKIKNAVRRFLLLAVVFLMATFLSVLTSNTSYAATANGIYADGNGARWEYDYSDESGEADLRIRFYDKSSDATEVKVPSLHELAVGLSLNEANLNTYILENADTDAQNAAFATDYPRRVANAATTKLDMSNTSKIQIRGVAPIIDPEVETELVFGENMVIGDTWHKRVIAHVCSSMYYNSWNDAYSCDQAVEQTFEGFEDSIEGWDSMTVEEKTAYKVTPADLGYGFIPADEYYVSASDYDPSKSYIRIDGFYDNSTVYEGGAFAGYKLKLTNFDGDKFNYVGYETFKGSTFNETNTTMTVSGEGLRGAKIFAETNIKKAIINTDTYGTGLFKDCAGLTEVEFGSNATKVSDETFSGTTLTAVDFSNTNIKEIGANAYSNAHVSTVNLEGVERIGYSAFTYNDIQELYMPKSINFLRSNIFYGNKNLKKVTVAYDTLTSGTTLPFYIMLDGNVRGRYDNNAAGNHIEELTVLAPYATDEAVSATHTTYDDYRFHYHPSTQEHITDRIVDHSSDYGFGWVDATHYKILYPDDPSHESYHFEDDYADVDSKKNIIAPLYFTDLTALKKIKIGEGYEYVGSSAFWSREQNSFGDWWLNKVHNANFNGTSNTRHVEDISLPESLVGIGNMAFEEFWLEDGNTLSLPKNLEFIGQAAFRRIWNFKTDVDLPNLKYLGDYAFESTMVQNIVLHDKMYYMGEHVFSNCLSIKDITIDYDIFNPDLKTVWAGSSDLQLDTLNHNNYFREQFGEWYHALTSASDDFINAFDVNIGYYPLNYSGKFQKFNKITFTDKVVHEIPMLENICSGVDWWGNPNCVDRRFSQTGDLFFGHLIADEIDISKTGWKLLPPNAFNNSKIGKLLLPEKLEAISAYAFNALITDNELVLPDTVKYIGERAFEGWGVEHYGYAASPTIKRLPSSLEYIGDEAFWGVTNLTADLNAPNLKYIGIRAFYGTNIRDVLIPEGVKKLREGTFGNAPSLRNITINADFGAIVSGDAVDEFETPQLIKDYINDPEKEKYYLQTGSVLEEYDEPSEYCNGFCLNVVGKPFATFYTIFNGIEKEDENDRTDYQSTTGANLGTLTFGPKNTTLLPGTIGIFSYHNFDQVDMSKAGWTDITDTMALFYNAKIGTLKLPEALESVPDSAFMYAEVTEPFALPNSLKKLDRASFQWSKINLSNALPDNLETIDSAAFYATDPADELIIPASVTSIGWSAFNAGDADVHYDSVTIKPSLTARSAQGQMVHQLFWNADIRKLTVESPMLVAIEKKQNGNFLNSDQEFYNMPIEEVTLTSVPGITRQAFVNCDKLEKVDMSKNANLRYIDEEAFLNDKKLHKIKFAPEIKNETVTIGKNAFKTTAFETMGDNSTDFDLTAAKFDGSEGYAFAGMPKLRSVDVPESFSNQTIPRATFYNDAALEKVTVAYPITEIRNAAFANDDQLAQIFIWGDTAIEDKNIGGYTMPTRAPDDTVGSEFGPTIPEGTDIYAYSANVTETYAAFDGRENFDGVFYPLDEVLYLTSNRPRVQFNEAQDDFDKSNLVVYGLRRDGVVLQSDNWGEFDGVAYPRSAANLTFEKMDAAIAANPAEATVYDTPVPVRLLSLANENFANIDFEFIRDDDDETGEVRLINIIYTDAYTGGEPDTDIDPYAVPEESPETNPIIPFLPTTFDGIAKYVVMFTTLGGVAILLKRRSFAKE